jgi:hypothetical protein
MKKNKPIPVLMIIAIIGILVICSEIYISSQNNMAIVRDTVSQLEYQANTQAIPATFSSDRVLEDNCIEIAFRLAKQGYQLSTAKNKLISFSDKVMACHENHVITVKSKQMTL